MTDRRIAVLLAAFLYLLLEPALAFACPLCHTETGAAVRAGIFDGRFSATLLAVFAPLAATLAAIAALDLGLRRGEDIARGPKR